MKFTIVIYDHPDGGIKIECSPTPSNEPGNGSDAEMATLIALSAIIEAADEDDTCGTT